MLDERPDAFGPFRVRAELGAGRFGPVYVGRDSSNARVVICTFELPNASRGSAEETELLDSLRKLCANSPDHPSIARPLAFGVEGNVPYLVSTYLPGAGMDVSIQKDGARPLDDVLERVTQIAAAIDLAAASGVCHGMLEPHDVIFDAGATGVTGFGLAQALLRVGIPVDGRSPYASPQRQAGALPTCPDDVYSLAALALELVIGKPSVGSQDPSAAIRQAQGLPERRRVPRPAPHETRVFTTIPGIDAGLLRAVFAAAFAEEPGERPATGSDFVASFKEAIVNRHGADQPSPSNTNSVSPFSSEDEGAGVPAPSPSTPRASNTIHPASDAIHRTSDTIRKPTDGAATPMDLPLRRHVREPEMALSFAEPVVHDSPSIDRPALFGSASEMPVTPRGSRALSLTVAIAVGLIAGFAGGFVVGQRSAVSTPTPSVAAQGPAPLAGAPTTTDAPAPTAPRVASPTPTPVEAPEPIPEAPAIAPSQPPVAVPTPSRPEPQFGRLLVRSTPAGAGVTVDGQARGATPLALRDLALGDHTIEVTSAGHDTRQQRVTLTARRPARSLDFELRPTGTAGQALAVAGAPGALQIFSRPAGAEVFLDDNLIGTTPLLVSNVPAGSHRVRLQMSGYQTWLTAVQIESGTRFRVAASLEQ